MKPIVVGHFYLAVYIAAISIKKAIIIIKIKNKRNHHNFIFIQPPLNESNQIISKKGKTNERNVVWFHQRVNNIRYDDDDE